ncbi:MAG: radical SAM protein [Nanoarchaeota archaeon]
MNDKIMFINPPQSASNNVRQIGLKFPLGLMYMASILEKSNFKVKILDCPLYYKKKRDIGGDKVRIGLFPEEITKTVLDFQPDIVGVSCAYSAFERDSFETISIVKKAEKKLGKKILIVVGGAHVSSNPKYVLRNKEIGIAVIGEGEETMLEIAENNRKGKSLIKIKGTAVNSNKIIINERREPIKNIDTLTPAWHLINMNSYFAHPDNSRATLRKNSVDIITSRGCPGNCVFCSIHTVWGRKWRGRQAKNVVDEIELLVKKYGAKQFRIQDDNLTLDKKRTIEICDEIIKRKLDIRWDTPNGIAVWTLDEEVLRKMKQAGCYRVTFGVESGSKNTQKYIRKLINSNKIHNLIDTCHKLGIWVCATFIIGFPYEKKQDILETENFIRNSRINFPFIYVAQPYPGTDMYNDFVKEKLMKDIKETSNICDSKYDTLNFSHDHLNKKRMRILKKFYLARLVSYSNPITLYTEFVSKIRSFEDFKYIFKNLALTILGS